MKKIIALFMALLLIVSFTACKTDSPADRKDPETPESSENPEAPAVSEPETISQGPVEDGKRKEVSSEKFENATEIILSENITVNGKPASESDSVTIGGEIVYYHDIENYPSGNPYGNGEKKDRHTEEEAAEHTLVTITKPGEYFIKGELKGQIAVDLGKNAEKDQNAKVTLIFGGADITCEIAPAVIFYNVYECANAEKPSEDADTSKAGAKVFIADGSVNNINGANVAKIYKDNENEEKLHKYDAAFYSGMSLEIEGGTEGTGVLNINAENEGLGSEMHLTVNGGIINIKSNDDGVNANEDDVSVITVNGGKITVKGGLGKEGDGIDSNGWLVINGGELYSSGNGKGADGGIDADMAIIINGGKIAAFGGNNDVVRGECSQPFAQISFDERKTEGSKIRFVDKNGKGIETESDRDFYSLVISFPELEKEKEYELYVNDILQEYSSDKDIITEVEKAFTEFFENDGKPSGNNKTENPLAVPEGFDEWMENDKNIPENIREWLVTISGTAKEAEKFAPMVPNIKNNEKNSEKDQGMNVLFELDEKDDKDRTIFIITDDTKYFSGVHDSFEATGKERVSFTVNGENRIEDLYIGSLPEITSIECEKNIPAEHINITLEYSGRSEEIEVKRSCLLSEGYKAVNELFKDLAPGDYRLYVSVSSENKEYVGTSWFDFDVVD